VVNRKLENLITTAPEETAGIVGLVYVSDSDPGIRRRRQGKGFVYLDPQGQKVSSPKTIARIGSLVIPPAWKDVWICPSDNGHIQATGRDAKGRKQYIYHTRWAEISSINKFNLMMRFGEVLPLLRSQVNEDLKPHSFNRRKVLAILISLLEETLIRIGNTEYARDNGSFGLTTLTNNHVDISGPEIKLMFKGKSGKFWEVGLKNRRLARLVRKCQELPGQQLFQYMDSDGTLQAVSSQDVNEYLKNITGQDFSAKDFRTWGGTVMAARELYKLGPAATETEARKKITQTIKTVSSALNNTPSVCRKYYIHPEVIESFQDNTLFEEIRKAEGSAENVPFSLNREETAVLSILRQNVLKKEALLISA
ncbi:MAG: DNA topoisomerase IB, partial [Syntrophothermus sp.]